MHIHTCWLGSTPKPPWHYTLYVDITKIFWHASHSAQTHTLMNEYRKMHTPARHIGVGLGVHMRDVDTIVHGKPVFVDDG